MICMYSVMFACWGESTEDEPCIPTSVDEPDMVKHPQLTHVLLKMRVLY